MATRRLSARQAAAQLGVKVETIYAYVSRGLLERLPAPDGRTSEFDPRAVERLARRRRGAPSGGGLPVALGTGLTLLEDDRLCFRGLDVRDWIGSAPYESIAEWLWLGEHRPEPVRPEAFTPWTADASLLAAIARAAESLPVGGSLADRVRAGAGLVGPHDPLRFDLAPRGVAATTRRLLAALVDGLPRVGLDAPAPLAQIGGASLPGTLAERLWPRLSMLPGTVARVALLNAAMSLLADHGMASSTLAVRIAASVRADPCSCVSAGLATVAGTLHGAASTPVHRLLASVREPTRAVAVVGEMLRTEPRIPGFGHAIYTGWDPRARILLDWLRRSDLPRERIAVVDAVLDVLLPGAPVHPNVDFALGGLSFAAEMPESAGEAVFAVARIAGWIAHVLEEYEEQPVRFRPRAHYTGPGVSPESTGTSGSTSTA